MRLSFSVFTLAGLLAASAGTSQDVEPDLEQLLSRAGRYVQRHDRELGGLAAEETFNQKLFKQRNSGLLKMRLVRSDVVFMGAPNDFRWAALRDAFEVDGKPVRDHAPRLERLFLDTPSMDTALEQAAPIVEKSAAHDLGGAAHNFNIPTLVLAFLHPDNQRRFRFARKGRDVVEGVAVWAVEYAEQQSPAFIRDAEGRDLYGSGTVWIDPADGKIVRTYFKVSDAAGLFQVELTTTFRYWSENALWVPKEMRESRSFKPQAVDRVPTRRVDTSQTTRGAGGQVGSNPRFGSSIGEAADSTSGIPTEYVESVAQYSGYRRFGEFAPAAALVAAAAPVTIDHVPAGCMAPGRFPRLRACFHPAAGVARATVHFRAAGTPHWYAVEMQPDDKCHAARLPQPKAKGVEYFIDLVTTTTVEARTRRYEVPVSKGTGACGDAADTDGATVTVLAGPGSPPLPVGFNEAGIVTAAAPAGWILADPAASVTARSRRSQSSGRTDDIVALGVGGGLLASGAYIKLTNHGGREGGNPEDGDGDGYTEALGDCNDSRRDIRPGAGFSAPFGPYAFQGSNLACSQPNVRQQIYRVTNLSCEPMQIDSLRYTLQTSGEACSVQGFSEELGLSVRSLQAGESTTIRLGPAAGLAWPMCCAGGRCPSSGNCLFTERYTLRTSVGERTYTNQYTINTGDGTSCLSCDLPQANRRAY